MNFARCEAYYDNNTQAQRLYNYTGHVYGGRIPDGKYITAADCRLLCGNGVQIYRWRDIAATITTWVLPMLGMLLTAPFVSNAFRKTMQATCRWVGSPIVSLAHGALERRFSWSMLSGPRSRETSMISQLKAASSTSSGILSTS